MRYEIHVIAGLGGWLFAWGTKALDKLFDDLSPYWDATHWYHGSWEKCAQGIIDRQKRFNDAPVVCLIGHSYGALRCQQIASRLNQHGIEVAYIGGIDPTALPRNHPPMVIPSNVKDVDEFHATSGWPAWARHRDPQGGRGGMYVYRPDATPAIYTIPGGHIACASAPKTRRIILGKVKALVS